MMLTNRRGSRPIGAFAVGPQGVRYHPVVDVRVVTFVVAGVATAVAAASAAVALRRRGPVIGSVAMGPGGWVSVKGVAVPPLWPAGRQQHGRRPWWARLLGARRLVVQQ